MVMFQGLMSLFVMLTNHTISNLQIFVGSLELVMKQSKFKTWVGSTKLIQRVHVGPLSFVRSRRPGLGWQMREEEEVFLLGGSVVGVVDNEAACSGERSAWVHFKAILRESRMWGGDKRGGMGVVSCSMGLSGILKAVALDLPFCNVGGPHLLKKQPSFLS